VKRGKNMNLTMRQGTERITELRRPDFEAQPLRQYLDLLQTSLDRYEYLKKSGTPDIILFVEKGLIDRQILFVSKACEQLTK
jgi:hypothetical protein